MNKHTPGPWFLSYDQGRTRDVIAENGKPTICMVRNSWVSADQYQANCHLIAAAPDLLAVLQELEQSSDYWSEYDVPLGIVERIKSAIAKAKGEQP